MQNSQVILQNNEPKTEFIDPSCKSEIEQLLEKFNVNVEPYLPSYDDYVDFDSPLYTCFKAVDDDE